MARIIRFADPGKAPNGVLATTATPAKLPELNEGTDLLSQMQNTTTLLQAVLDEMERKKKWTFVITKNPNTGNSVITADEG